MSTLLHSTIASLGSFTTSTFNSPLARRVALGSATATAAAYLLSSHTMTVRAASTVAPSDDAVAAPAPVDNVARKRLAKFWDSVSDGYAKKAVPSEEVYQTKLLKSREYFTPSSHVYEFGCGELCLLLVAGPVRAPLCSAAAALVVFTVASLHH